MTLVQRKDDQITAREQDAEDEAGWDGRRTDATTTEPARRLQRQEEWTGIREQVGD